MSGVVAVVLIVLLALALWLWVVVDVRGRRDMPGSTKGLWIAAAFFFPVIATLAYLLAGRRRTS